MIDIGGELQFFASGVDSVCVSERCQVWNVAED